MHDNVFGADPDPKEAYDNATYEETAIILEWRTEKTLIERNMISGYNQALYFNVREGVYDFTFRNNECTKLGGNAGSMLRMDGHGADMRVENFTLTDNLFEGDPDAMSGFGIIVSQVMGTWSGKDIRIAGNAVGNTLFNWLVIDGYTSIDGLTVQDNAYHDAGGEYKLRAENDVSGYVFSGNEEAGVDQWLVKRLGK